MSQCFENERCWWMAQDLGFHILRSDQPLPQSVLCCWRMKLSAGYIGYCCAVTSRPKARELQEPAGIVHQNPASLLLERLAAITGLGWLIGQAPAMVSPSNITRKKGTNANYHSRQSDARKTAGTNHGCLKTTREQSYSEQQDSG